MASTIYKSSNANGNSICDFGLINQIRATAVPTMSYIAEGFSRKKTKDFIQFLYISNNSTAEVQSQLSVALDQNDRAQQQFEEIHNQAKTARKLTSGFIKYLRKNRYAEKPKHLSKSDKPVLD